MIYWLVFYVYFVFNPLFSIVMVVPTSVDVLLVGVTQQRPDGPEADGPGPSSQKGRFCSNI